MEVKVIELTDDYAKLLIKGEDHTYLNLLQYELVNDESVLLAKYNVLHPLKDEAEFMIRTSGKSPIDALREANERIISKVEEVLSQL
ncbi:DNA-directed RNA polymerase, subunit L [Geoglobus ahangari]|uniref:DNA-directed RNA polymerase subunit Rpo11 n=1 Tax=Geoglobus ahangari TaxID=113653 RepID=A0A0F7IDQ2_9EURY|nr:DNA-directed RNA polymerase subunit L [Geoglobus ahangari]AKG91602.1 DNA-directed RNA polymerase, subunit L [Geoglobus ahangari]NOY11016.1 DNA-directed RNA polymerase subunit L [Archaeoglobi archaeon]